MSSRLDATIPRAPDSACRIISLGEVLWDLLPDGDRLGGAPANFACHAAIQGAQVTILSAVGDDRHGQDALNILENCGIDVSLIQIATDSPTGTVGVELDDDGKPMFTIHAHSAWDQLTWRDQVAPLVAAADAVYFGTLGQRSHIARRTIRSAVETAEAAGITRVLDINLRAPFFDARLIHESIQLASILKLSDDELAEVCCACGIAPNDNPHERLRGLLVAGGLDMVVLTQGAEGATVVTQDSTTCQQGIATTVVDTIGAGDSFTAAFLIGELGGEPHETNLRRACEVAAATCSHSGAIPEVRQIDSGQQP